MKSRKSEPSELQVSILNEVRKSTQNRFLAFMKEEDPSARIVKSQEDVCVLEFTKSEKKIPAILRHFKRGLNKFLIESWSLSQTNLKDVFKKVVVA